MPPRKLFIPSRALFSAALMAFLLPAALAAQRSRPDSLLASRLEARHSEGQTFLTWAEADTGNVRAYRVYYFSAPITQSNLDSASVLCESVPSGSGVDYIERAITRQETGFVVSDLAQPLTPGTGLYVHTADRNGRAWYAVASLDAAGRIVGGIVLGRNSLESAVNEEISQPEPVSIERRNTPSGQVDIYNHWVDRSMHPAEGMAWRFAVATASDYEPAARHLLLVVLHGAGGRYGTLHQGGREWVTLYPDMRNVNFHRKPDLGFDGNGANFWIGENESFYSPDDPYGGLDVNYDEQRVLWTIDWAMRHYNIDPDRVHIQGGSMGGYATLNLALHHPELFASAFASVPPTDMTRMSPYGDSIAVSHWGPAAANIMTNLGQGFYDQADLIKFVREHPELDFPLIMTLHGKKDFLITWNGPHLFYQAMQETGHALIAVWTTGPHAALSPGVQVPEEYYELDLHSLRRNESYPAIANASTNDDPGEAHDQGAPFGQLNAGYEWRDIVDFPREYGITLAPLNGRQFSATADITPRRLQRFHVAPGEKVAWDNVDLGERRVVQSGMLRVDRNGLLTFRGFRINPKGNRLRLRIK